MGDWSDGVRENGLEKHENKIKKIRYDQGYQYRTGGHTGLATGTIYFRYRSIPVYRFGFTVIFYVYK